MVTIAGEPVAPLNRTSRLVAAAGLVSLLALPGLIGAFSGILANLAALLLIPALVRRRAWPILQRDLLTKLLLGTSLALSVLFVVTAKTPYHLAYIANFLPLALAPIVWYAARSAEGYRLAQAVALLALAGAAIAATVALVETGIMGASRASGLFGNANILARAAVLLGFIAMTGAMTIVSPWRFVFYLGPLAAAVVVYATASRGAALALPVLALLAVVWLIVDRRTRRDGLVAAAVLLVAFAAALSLGPVARIAGIAGILENLFTTGQTDDFTTLQRLDMYRAAFQAFQLSPLIGHGWGSLGTLAATLNPERFAGSETLTFFMFHNDLLNFAASAGIVGIACWVTLLAAPLAGAFAVARDGLSGPRLYLCAVISVAYAIFGLTDNALGYDLLTALYAFITALVIGGVRETEPMRHSAGPAES